jgi:NADH-quinone oxidoreductase subunit J
VLGPLSVIAATMMVLSRNAVHAALFLAAVMLSLAGLYAAQDAPFLAAVQVIVYTGAILMLSCSCSCWSASDSATRSSRRCAASASPPSSSDSASPAGCSGHDRVGRRRHGVAGLAEANAEGNVIGLARLLFTDYLIAFERHQRAALTARSARWSYTHSESLVPKLTQRERARRRSRATRRCPARPRRLRRHNSTATPALLRTARRRRHSVAGAGATTAA